MMPYRWLGPNAHRLALALIVLVAAALRLYGQDWDEGHYLHPDERFIAIVSGGRVEFPSTSKLDTLFDPEQSPINPRRDDENGNPHSFAYGSLPIYVQGVVSWALDRFWDRDWGAYENLYRVGRTLTALLDVVTLLLAYLVGRRLFGVGAGLLAAALYAFAVLPIQLSHFFTVDPWLTTFVTAVLYLSIRYIDVPSPRTALLLGAAVGCAFATKASVPSLLAPLLLAFGYAFWRSAQRPRIALHALAGGLLSLGVFTLFEPYALVNRGPFIEDIRVQSRIVRGVTDVPFTRQFVGLTAGFYELENLFRYTAGPALLLAGLAGLVYMTRGVWRRRDAALAVPLVWALAYVPTLLITEARFPRYTLPLLPVLTVVAGGLLWTLVTDARWRAVGSVATAAVLGVTAVWGLGFVSIYSNQHPRIAASEWIYDNVEAGSTLTAEAWDDALPLRIDGETTSYQWQSLDIYGDRPPEEKANELYDALVSVDYVVMSSDRLIYSIDNLPWRYAVQSEYYRRLLDGQLGFQLVYRAELRPELFGYRYDDSGADESFTVYDHPRVQIFQRVENLSREEFRARLLWGINQPWEPQRYPAREWLQLDQPVGETEAATDTGWNELAVDGGLFASLVWLAALELFGLAVLPWSALIFRRTPDRGALAARLLGLLTVSWLVWIGASLGFWPATAPVVALILALLAALCWSWYRWRPGHRRAPDLPTPKTYASVFGLILAIFALFLTFRATYPDVWQTYLGGEKPFEMAYLRAVAASREMPPYDPWYSDGTINYYYYGWHVVATLGRLPGVGVENAFQLAIPTFAALLAAQVVLVGLMLGQVRARVRLQRRHVATAASVVVLVLFAGNFDAFRQVVELRSETPELFDFWGSTRVIDFTINEFPYFTFLWADVHSHAMNLPVFALVVALLVGAVLRLKDVAEPPALTFQDGAAAAAGAVALGSAFVINAWDLPLLIAMTVAALAYGGLLRSYRAAVVAAFLGVALVGVGYLLFMPFHAHFYSVVEGVARPRAGSDLGQFLTFWGVFFIIVGAAVVSQALRTGRRGRLAERAVPLLLVTALGGGGGLIWTLLTNEEPLGGASLVALVIVLLFAAAASIAARPMARHPLTVVAFVALIWFSGFLAVFEPSAAVALGLCAAAAMLAVAGWRQPGRFLPWAFVAVACITIASTELVYIVDDLQGGDWQRMNTVFKFYLQAWLLLGIGAAVLLVRLWRNALGALPGNDGAPVGIAAGRSTSDSSARLSAAQWRQIATIALGGVGVLAVVASLFYPVFATPVRLRQDMPTSPDYLTLDGYAWMEGASIPNHTGQPVTFTDDLVVIEWLDRNARQTDVIVEAGIGPYRGNGARISSGTGMPAVIGWDRHQHQQRFPEGIAQRMADVKTIYNSASATEKLELLRRYRAKYVIVGDVERYWNFENDEQFYASEAGLAAFESMVGSSLRVAFASGTTIVYEVLDFPSIPPAPDAKHEL
jgi:YYY domain-containing protein